MLNNDKFIGKNQYAESNERISSEFNNESLDIDKEISRKTEFCYNLTPIEKLSQAKSLKTTGKTQLGTSTVDKAASLAAVKTLSFNHLATKALVMGDTIALESTLPEREN